MAFHKTSLFFRNKFKVDKIERKIRFQCCPEIRLEEVLESFAERLLYLVRDCIKKGVSNYNHVITYNCRCC